MSRGSSGAGFVHMLKWMGLRLRATALQESTSVRVETVDENSTAGEAPSRAGVPNHDSVKSNT